jgi:hypothetical protein
MDDEASLVKVFDTDTGSSFTRAPRMWSSTKLKTYLETKYEGQKVDVIFFQKSAWQVKWKQQ